MSCRIEIAGMDRTDEFSAAEFSLSLNERGTATFEGDPEMTLPARYAELVVYGTDGVTPVVGGVVYTRGMAGLSQGSQADAPTFDLQDWGIYASWCYITLAYDTDVALEDVIADLVAQKLAAFGITYTPVATGITLGKFSWTRKLAGDCLRELSDRAGVVFQWHPDKSLTADGPGAAAAPVAITDAAPHCLDLIWKDTERTPANAVIMVCGEGQQPQSEDFSAPTAIAPGVSAVYITSLPASQSIDDLWPNVLRVNGVIIGPVSWGDDPSFAWWWDAPNHKLWHILARGGYVPVGGDVITIPYTAQYPFEVTRTSGAVPAIEMVVERTDVFTVPQANEIGDGILAGLSQTDPRELEILTDEEGFAPGQQLTVNLTTMRGTVIGAFLITAMRVALQTLTDVLYTLTAIPQYQGSFLSDWRQLTGGSSGSSAGGSAGGGSSSPSIVLSSPFPLGGSRSQSLPVGTVSTAVLDWLPFVSLADQTVSVRVTVRARDAGVAVTPVLTRYDSGSMTWVTHATGSAETATAEVEQTFAAALTSGETYRLEYKTGTAGASAYAIGQLESL